MHGKEFMMQKTLVPDSFIVPDKYNCEHFYIKKLSPKIVDIDYKIVIDNVDFLKETFGPYNKWPFDDLTVEQNFRDLEWHAMEFKKRTSFAYSINSIANDYVGCLYIYPSFVKKYDAMIIFWTKRDSPIKDKLIYSSIKDWIYKKWPFKNPVFPGREIQWNSLEYKNIYSLKEYYARNYVKNKS